MLNICKKRAYDMTVHVGPVKTFTHRAGKLVITAQGNKGKVYDDEPLHNGMAQVRTVGGARILTNPLTLKEYGRFSD